MLICMGRSGALRHHRGLTGELCPSGVMLTAVQDSLSSIVRCLKVVSAKGSSVSLPNHGLQCLQPGQLREGLGTLVPWKHLQGSALQVSVRAGTQHPHPLCHTTTVMARDPKSRKKSSTTRWRNKEKLCDSPPKGSKERRGGRTLGKAFSLPSRGQHLPVSKIPGQSLSAPLLR